MLADGAGEQLVVIHGHCPQGADHLADRLARQWGATVVREPADWGQYNAAAGPIRNQLMLTKHRPDVVYAFRAAGKSNGTDNMVKLAVAAGLPTYVITAAS